MKHSDSTYFLARLLLEMMKMQTTRQMNAATWHWVLTCVFWACIAVRNHEAKIVALLDDEIAVSEKPVG
jgi:hypothetical protein